LYFLPFVYKLQIVNEKNDSINTTVVIYWHNYKLSTGYGSKLSFILPSSSYEVEITSYGYKTQRFAVKNRLFNYRLIKRQTGTIHPKEISLAKFEYLDPTGTVKVYPKFRITGTTIQGDNVEQQYDNPPTIQSGYYSVDIYTDYFTVNLTFQGENLTGNSSIIFLEPNKENTLLDETELGYIENYFNDYINLSNLRKMDLYHRGYPKQYYLYSRKKILSLGDMFLLFCEKEAYKQSKRDPVYFVMPNKAYSLNGTYPCYASMLEGKVPKGIGEKFYGSKIEFPIAELNQHKNRLAIAFSYDIESGRYLNKGNDENGIGPCTDEVYSLGIPKENLDCNDADYTAWFTPLLGQARFTEYPYPWVSGILGFKEILSFSSKYGIPSTYYIVAREINVYEELAPEVVEETKYLVKQGLVEIGSQTYYHTRLGIHSIDFDKEQILASKAFLENEFDTNVTGIRGPYFSLIGNSTETNAKVLNALGFSYSSNEYTSYISKISEAPNKPVNAYILSHAPASLISLFPVWYTYVITVDHPWNMYYSEITKDGYTYLEENPIISDYYRAMVLSTISEGYIPYLVKDIDTNG